MPIIMNNIGNDYYHLRPFSGFEALLEIIIHENDNEVSYELLLIIHKNFNIRTASDTDNNSNNY